MTHIRWLNQSVNWPPLGPGNPGFEFIVLPYGYQKILNWFHVDIHLCHAVCMSVYVFVYNVSDFISRFLLVFPLEHHLQRDAQLNIHMHVISSLVFLPLPVLSLFGYFTFVAIWDLTSFYITVNLIIGTSWGPVSCACSVYSLYTINVSIFCKCSC